MAAIATLALQPWPFAGAVAWRESEHPQQPWHVLENWCYLGSVPDLDAAAALLAVPARFDVDTYQILAPRLDALRASAVPLAASRPFALTPPEPPAPSRAPSIKRPARTTERSSDTQTLTLFA